MQLLSVIPSFSFSELPPSPSPSLSLSSLSSLAHWREETQRKNMKGRFCCFVLLVLQLVSWASAARTIPHSLPAPEQAPQSSPYTDLEPKQDSISESMREKYNTGVSKIGSTPPICKHKCNGCTPCEAIQVPSTSRQHNHQMGIQYANYEPESWKCKCGPSFYSP